MLRASQQNTWKRTFAAVEKMMSKQRIAASARREVSRRGIPHINEETISKAKAS
jgi:hypothetical protein